MPRGRKKGQKTASTIMKENGNITPIKNVKPKDTTTKDRIKKLATKKGKPVMPKHVLKLTDWLYISCDAHCWRVVEVNDKCNPTTGEKYPDKPLLYSSSLDGIIKLSCHYLAKVPADVIELGKKLDNIYKLIDSRIPKNIKPKDLFEDMQKEEVLDD